MQGILKVLKKYCPRIRKPSKKLLIQIPPHFVKSINQLPTWGQEIETGYVKQDFEDFTRKYLDGHFDGSGPWEFSVGPFTWTYAPTYFLYKFANDWDLEPYESSEGEELGCHLHVRPSNRFNIKWIVYYENLLALILLMPYNFAYFSEYDSNMKKIVRFRFRSTFDYWARINISLNQLDILKYRYENGSLRGYLESYSGREHGCLTLNRNLKRTLTIEARINEAHILKAYLTVNILVALDKASIQFKVKDNEILRDYYYSFGNWKRLDAKIYPYNLISEPKIFPNKELSYIKIAYIIYKYTKKYLTPLARKVFTWLYFYRKPLSTNFEIKKFITTNNVKLG